MTKNIFITGGTSGIGKAIVFKFAKKNWNIFYTYFNNKKEAINISKNLQDLKIKHSFFKMDLNNKNSIKKAFEVFSKQFKKLDYLINNANPPTRRKKFLRIDDEEIKKNINGFLVGNLIVIKKALKLILNNKNKEIVGILNISSYSSMNGGKNIHLYAASKAALNILMNALSIDYIKNKIKIQSVLPRYINTKSFRKNNNIKNNKDLLKFMKKKGILEIKNPEEFSNFIYDIIINKNKFKNKLLIKFD